MASDMPRSVSFRDDQKFPSVRQLPVTAGFDGSIYYSRHLFPERRAPYQYFADSRILEYRNEFQATEPSRHWCMFAQVTRILDVGDKQRCLFLEMSDKYGREFVLRFRLAPAEDIFDVSRISVGSTLVMLYPFWNGQASQNNMLLVETMWRARNYVRQTSTVHRIPPNALEDY